MTSSGSEASPEEELDDGTPGAVFAHAPAAVDVGSRPRVRILVVVQQPILREALVNLLRSIEDFDVVGDVATSAECRTRLASLAPEVVVCDLPANVLATSVQVDRLSALNPHTPVIILAEHETHSQVLDLVRRGFKGLLTSQSHGVELFEAIRIVSRGGRFLDSAVQVMLLQAMGADLHEPGSRPTRLTSRERSVLELVARGMTNPQIAVTLHISTSTVKQCVSHLLQKLGAANRAGAVSKAVSEGLLSS